MQEKFALGVGDADTPLADEHGRQAFETGAHLFSSGFIVPDAVFVSPYLRALETLRHLIRGWQALADVPTFQDERVREQEHGLSLLYNDWRVFHALHPEQGKLRALEGSYWYRYPQGENIPDVRMRNRDFLGMLVREYSGKSVLVVTHHLNILAMRANLERLDAEAFVRLDVEDKPINCGVTVYRGVPEKGKNGKLVLDGYNSKYYE